MAVLDVDMYTERANLAPASDAEIRRLDAWRGWVLCATVVLCPVAYSFHVMSFLHPKELVLSTGLCVVASLVLARGRWTWAGVGAFLPLWVLVLWASVVHLVLGVAQVPSYAAIELDRVALLLLAPALSFDLLRRPRWRRRVMTALVLSGVPVAALGLLQYANLILFMFPVFPGYHQRAYSVFGNQDLFGQYLAVCSALAIIGLFRGRRLDKICLVSLPILLGGLLISGSRSAWLGAAGGLLPALAYAPRRPLRLGVLVAATVAVGAATVYSAPEATLHRFTGSMKDTDVGFRVREWIWHGSVLMAREHPIVGVGPGNFCYWSPRYLGAALHAPCGDQLYRNELFAVHAESEPLELLCEGGIVGAALLLWMLARVLRRCGPEWAGLAALLATSLFGFPLHSAPNALAGLLLAGILLARGRPAVEGRGALALPMAAYPLAVLFVWAVFVPSALLRSAEDAHLAHEPSQHLYERAVRWPWPSPQAHAHYAFALSDYGELQRAVEQLQLALRGLDTGDLYYALGALATQTGDYKTAEQQLRECLYRWPSKGAAQELYDFSRKMLQHQGR
jgi:O-antigen ligase